MTSNAEQIIAAIIPELQKMEPTALTEEKFNSIAEEFRNMYTRRAPISDEEFEYLKKELKARFNIRMETGTSLKSKTIHKSWVPNRRGDTDFYYWDRYSEYLKYKKGWTDTMVNTLSSVSEEILDLCGDPTTERFAIKGLVLGEVQSGKTANYTAICNKAVDFGYKVIIVLAGMQDNLRQQTQSRLELELVGKDSNNMYKDNGTQFATYNLIGVGAYGRDNVKESITLLTSVNNDFSRKVTNNMNLSISSLKSTVLLVVKKNKTVLNNLISWLVQNNNLNNNKELEFPLLLIDDEADNASVNTKDPSEDPTAINKCIRQLLKLFDKSTYLAITATPFANIFIDSEDEDDLFPSDFIYALSAPSNYIGANQFFNADDGVSSYVVPIDSQEIEEVFPLKHKKDYSPTELPASLKEALNYFLLANAIRDARGDNSSHRSMLVHMSRFTNVQNQIAGLINDWLVQMRNNVRSYAHMSYWRKTPLSELYDVWVKFNLESTGLKWDDILTKYLYKAIAPIDVKAINMDSSASKLDYGANSTTGLRVIAVGGNSLSRGLTLEGLNVSYFLRDSKMYDTLLQMARWFGYRAGYEDLVKVWLPYELNDAFQQIAQNTRELRAEIIKMSQSNMTPSNYRLRVREDPGSLMVTARNKMRNSNEMEMDISVSGKLIESYSLNNNLDELDHNKKIFLEFVSKLSTIGKRVNDKDRVGYNYYWSNVDQKEVANLVGKFLSSKWNLSFETSSLANYISTNEWKNGWDVVLMNTGEGDEALSIPCGDTVLKVAKTQRRKINVNESTITFQKCCIGSGHCTTVGLTHSQLELAKAIHNQEYGKKKAPSARTYLLEDRPPLLMLHVIEAHYQTKKGENLPEFLYVIGLGFPYSDEPEKRVKYRINLVGLRNELMEDEDEG